MICSVALAIQDANLTPSPSLRTKSRPNLVLPSTRRRARQEQIVGRQVQKNLPGVWLQKARRRHDGFPSATAAEVFWRCRWECDRGRFCYLAGLCEISRNKYFI